jgi:cytoskeletal protein CcmA (bactofilin family)
MSNPYDTATERRSILGPTLRFKGDLEAEEDLVIEGRLEGTIRHTERVTIGRFANVRAEVHAQTIVVEGTIEGELHASASVSIAESGTVRGDVHAPAFTVVAGARFSGNVVKVPAERTAVHRPATDHVATGAKSDAAP